MDLVVRSTRPDMPDDTEDCCDVELVARALDERRGEGGAIEGVDRCGEDGRMGGLKGGKFVEA